MNRSHINCEKAVGEKKMEGFDDLGKDMVRILSHFQSLRLRRQNLLLLLPEKFQHSFIVSSIPASKHGEAKEG